MSMKLLDRLVARLITDGQRQGRFDARQLARDLEALDAPLDVREALQPLSALTWEDFVRRAYHVLLDVEQALEIPVMPSALEGLKPVRVIEERVA